MPKRFKCVICHSDRINEENLARHHRKQHPNLPKHIFSQIIELCAEDEYTKCNVCGAFMKKDRLEKHMHRCQWKIPTLNLRRPRRYFIRMYKCGLCDALSVKGSFRKHHVKNHRGFSFKNNDFTFSTVRQRFPCEFCGRRTCERRNEKHQLKTCLQYVNKKKMSQREIKPKQHSQEIQSDDE